MSDLELQHCLANSAERERAFSALVKEYSERLYWHIRKMVLSHEDSNDILQNAFMKAWTGLDGFRGEAQLSTWLYRIATNETLTFLSSKHTRLAAQNTTLENDLLNNLSSDVYFDGDAAQMILQKAILTLPEKQRLVFNMKYFDDKLTFEEMERILGTSAGALKASYHHAVKKITKFVEDENKF